MEPKSPKTTKYSKEAKINFHSRLDAIYDKIPNDFVALVLAIDGTLKPNRITNVRYMKTVDFNILKHLETICAIAS